MSDQALTSAERHAVTPLITAELALKIRALVLRKPLARAARALRISPRYLRRVVRLEMRDDRVRQRLAVIYGFRYEQLWPVNNLFLCPPTCPRHNIALRAGGKAGSPLRIA